MKYTVHVTWSMWSTMDVEADSLDEAIEMTNGRSRAQFSVRENAETCDGSFQVNERDTREANPVNKSVRAKKVKR